MKRKDRPPREELLERKMVTSLRGKKRGECQPIQTGDMTAILTLTLDSLKKNHGMPCVYEPTPAGLSRFSEETIDFFDYVNDINSDPELEKKLIPDIEAWCIYLGIARNTLFEYEKRGGEWGKLIGYYKNVIAGAKKQLAMNGKIPPVLFIFDSANNHQYANVSEFKVSSTSIVVNSEQTQLERDIVQQGLVWDEEKRDFIPIGENTNVDTGADNQSEEGTSTTQ